MHSATHALYCVFTSKHHFKHRLFFNLTNLRQSVSSSLVWTGGKGRARCNKCTDLITRTADLLCYRKPLFHYPDSIIHNHISYTHNLTEFDEIMEELPTQGLTGSVWGDNWVGRQQPGSWINYCTELLNSAVAPLSANLIMSVLTSWSPSSSNVHVLLRAFLGQKIYRPSLQFTTVTSQLIISFFSQRSAYFFCDCHSSLHDTFTRYTFLLYNHFRVLVWFKGWVTGAAFLTINHTQIVLIDLNKCVCFLWTPVPLKLQHRQVCQQTEFPRIINVTALNFVCNVMKLIRILPQHYANPCTYYVYEISTFVSENSSCMYCISWCVNRRPALFSELLHNMFGERRCRSSYLTRQDS